MSVPFECVTALRKALAPDRVLTSPEDLLVYGYDGTWLERTPDVVVLPRDSSEISAVALITRAHSIPVVPRGGGSGLAGGSVASRGGVVLGTTLMDKILVVDPSQSIAVVQPGVINALLQAEVEKVGLFYPPDPASLNQATIGGNVATSASGPRCLKYGGTKDYVVGLDVVLPDGELVRLGGRSSGPGPDHHLIQTFIGSEGTLGIIAQVTVRLLSRRPNRGTVMATFARLEDASLAVAGVLQAGVVPLALEMMDQVTLRCVEAFLQAGLPTDCDALLLIDVDGDEEEVRQQIAIVADSCRSQGANRVERAASAAEVQSLWRARRSTSSSFGRLRPNKLGEDISVPRSAIPSMVREVQMIAERYRLLIPLFGHIGDGNLHPNILCDLRDTEEMTRVGEAARAIFKAAIDRGGTLSGEHGIGLLKRDFMVGNVDSAGLDLMARLKGEFDPDGLLNPGKILRN